MNCLKCLGTVNQRHVNKDGAWTEINSCENCGECTHWFYSWGEKKIVAFIPKGLAYLIPKVMGLPFPAEVVEAANIIARNQV